MENAPRPKPRAIGMFSSRRTNLARLSSEGFQGMVLAALEDNEDLIDAARALLEQPDDLVARLRAQAAQRGISMTDIVTDALERYLATARSTAKATDMSEAKDEV